MTEDARPSGGGFVHFLPLHLKEGLTCTAMQVATLPWGSPSHMAMIGHDSDDPLSRVAVIGYEWPVNWLRTMQPLKAFDLEWLHVQRFRSDYILAKGEHPFWNVRQGNDPPDVSVDSNSGQIGIECTRFAILERQKAHGLFRSIRRRISAIAPEHFAALSGHIVYMWFNNDNSTTQLPFGRPEDEAAMELVQSLIEYRPSSQDLWVKSGDGLPDPAPPLALHRTESGAAFYCVPMVNVIPDSILFNYAGFELGLAFTTTHRPATEWATLSERILQKDKADNN